VFDEDTTLGDITINDTTLGDVNTSDVYVVVDTPIEEAGDVVFAGNTAVSDIDDYDPSPSIPAAVGNNKVIIDSEDDEDEL
jgi:hypothetical protein